MAPFNKKKKGITIPPWHSVELELITRWNVSKQEVVITTDSGPIILNENNELFIEISGEDLEPVKVQIVPDFKNRILNFVEVIDVNAKPIEGCKGKISFDGASILKDEPMPIGEYLKRWDENIERFDKDIVSIKKRRNAFVILMTGLILFNAYVIIMSSSIWRYLNVLSIVVSAYVIYQIETNYKSLKKEYDSYKELRRQAFTTVEKI